MRTIGEGIRWFLRSGLRWAILALLELPPIGWQLFVLSSSRSDSTAFPSFLDTYATHLLTEPLIHRSAQKRDSANFALTAFSEVRERLQANWRVDGVPDPTCCRRRAGSPT